MGLHMAEKKKLEQAVVYFNNCDNRDHVGRFGSGAFFDLGTTGRQGTQARNLYPGQLWGKIGVTP
jgi:hypothetical protein